MKTNININKRQVIYQTTDDLLFRINYYEYQICYSVTIKAVHLMGHFAVRTSNFWIPGVSFDLYKQLIIAT